MEKEIFLPTLHWFAMTNTFSGSCGDFRFMAKPNVIMATQKRWTSSSPRFNANTGTGSSAMSSPKWRRRRSSP